MHLECRPDVQAVQATWSRYWAGELTERPILLADMPRTPGQEQAPFLQPYYFAVRPIDECIEKVEAYVSTTLWAGDAIPSYPVTFVPDDFALLLGAECEFSGEGEGLTGWVEPFLDDYDREIRFRPESKWFQHMADCARALKTRFDGRILIRWTQLQGGLDALSAIRGPEQLLMDLVTCPQEVFGALRQIDRALDDARDALAELFEVGRLGSQTRHGLYHPGRVDVPQCDFSCMISPEMFEQFELPSLRSECASLDGAEYHLDGPDAIRHLEAICTVEPIRLIQWQPGAGNAAARDWTDLYRRIDALGRGTLRSLTREQIRDYWPETIANYHVLTVTDVTTPAEVDDLIAELAETPRQGD